MNKVVLLAPTPPPAGGIAGWTVRMMNANLKNNWGVVVVDEKLLGNTETFGIGNKRRLSDEIKRTFGIWKNLIHELKSNEVKVVHSCIPSTTLAMFREYICACIAHNFKRPFIVHFRCTTSNTTQGNLGHYLFGKLCNKSDLVLALNQESFLHIKSVSKTEVELIPNFIDKAELHERETIKENINRALYVGGVIETKGCLVICEVAKYFPEIEFRLVGQADEIVTNKAENIDNVILLGPMGKEDVQKEMEMADLFLFLSFFRGEGFSNALAEAMAKGLPCIVSDWAANRDMIDDKGGCIVPIKSVEETVRAVDAMKDPNYRRKSSQYNYSKVKECYMADVIIDKYVDCYDRLINKASN